MPIYWPNYLQRAIKLWKSEVKERALNKKGSGRGFLFIFISSSSEVVGIIRDIIIQGPWRSTG